MAHIPRFDAHIRTAQPADMPTCVEVYSQSLSDMQARHNQRYPLLFRDYLRVHPASAAAYAELKRRLASPTKYSGGVPSLGDPHAGQEEHLPRVASVEYPEVKDPAVDLIYFAAEDWAAATGWEPGPADV